MAATLAGTTVGLVLFALASAASLAAAMVAFLVPESPVSGTAGALIATGGAALVLVAALCLIVLPARLGAVRGVLLGLAILGAVGVTLAGYFLMDPALTVAAVVALVGLALHLILPSLTFGAPGASA
jgi:hypothetical protein